MTLFWNSQMRLFVDTSQGRMTKFPVYWYKTQLAATSKLGCKKPQMSRRKLGGRSMLLPFFEVIGM